MLILGVIIYSEFQNYQKSYFYYINFCNRYPVGRNALLIARLSKVHCVTFEKVTKQKESHHYKAAFIIYLFCLSH